MLNAATEKATTRRAEVDTRRVNELKRMPRRWPKHRREWRLPKMRVSKLKLNASNSRPNYSLKVETEEALLAAAKQRAWTNRRDLKKKRVVIVKLKRGGWRTCKKLRRKAEVEAKQRASVNNRYDINSTSCEYRMPTCASESKKVKFVAVRPKKHFV